MNSAESNDVMPRLIGVGKERGWMVSQTMHKGSLEPFYVVFCTNFSEPGNPSSLVSKEVFAEGFQNMLQQINCIEGEASGTLSSIIGGYYWNTDTDAIENPFGRVPQKNDQPTYLFDAGWEPTDPDNNSIDERERGSGWTLFVDHEYQLYPHSGNKLQLFETSRIIQPPQLIALGEERSGITSQTLRKGNAEALYAVFCSDFEKPDNPSSISSQGDFAEEFQNTRAQINFIGGHASETLHIVIGGYHWNSDINSIDHGFGAVPMSDGQWITLFGAGWEPTHSDERSIDERNYGSGWTLLVRREYRVYPQSGDKFQILATPMELYKVHGIVRLPTGEISTDSLVRAFDKDMRSEQLLGETRTNLDGFYEICYLENQFRRAEKRSADLLVRVYQDSDEVVAESNIRFNAAEVEIVDLMIEGGEYLGPSTYENLLAELTPVLEDVPLIQLTDEDIQFLFGETEIAVAGLEKLRTAAILADDTDVPIEIFYAFFQQDLPTELNQLLRLSEGVCREALGIAFQENVIPLQIKAAVDESLKRLEELRASQELDESPEPGVIPVRDILETTLDVPEKQEKFMGLYFQHKGSIESFWSNLRADPDFQEQGLVDDLQTTLRLGLVAQSHARMVKYVQEGLRDGTLPGVQPSGVPQLMELAQLDHAGWRVLIDQQVGGAPIGYPEITPGETPEDQANNFAAAMAGTVEAAFPTQVVAHRIQRDQLPGADDLKTFFLQNPEFHIRKTGVDVYLAEHPTALDPVQHKAETTEQLGRMQRIYRLTGNYEAMRALVDDGLTSAKAIGSLEAEDFTTQYADRVGGAEAATKIHQKAKQSSSLALALYGKFGYAMNATNVAAVPVISPPEETQPNTFPEWRSLFGTEDLAFCDCEHCGSVYSPAAYLVDILNFLKDAQANESGERPAELLLKRRPDIAELELSCENTNTTPPYIDLVNELLESAIAPTAFTLDASSHSDDLDNGDITDYLIDRFANEGRPLTGGDEVIPVTAGHQWRIIHSGWLYIITKDLTYLNVVAYPQTSGSAEILSALPQHVNQKAYEVVAQAKYPWSLPFNLWWEEVRHYLQEFGVRRETVMEAFQTEYYEEESDEVDEQILIPSQLAIASELLGLTTLERTIITTVHTEPGDVADDWGLTTLDLNNLNRVSTLLERTGLTYTELRQVLGTMFVRSATEVDEYSIVPVSNDPALAGTCDTTQLLVIPQLTSSALDYFHRFVRLWRKLGWEIPQLDRAIDADIDDSLLIKLSQIGRLEQELKLPVDSLLKLWRGWGNDRLPVLAQALELSVKDILALQELTATDPLDDPQTTSAFISRARKVLDSSFTIAQLNYLYRHEDTPEKHLAPLREEIIALLTGLQDTLSRIAAENVLPDHPSLEMLQRKLATVFEPEEVVRFMAFVTRIPEDTQFNRAFLELSFPFVDVATAAPVLLVSAPPADEEARDTYLRQAAVFLLDHLFGYLRRTQSENLVKQTLSNALGLESALIDPLVGKFLTARTASGKPAINDYLSVVGNGVSSSYFNSADTINPVAIRTEPAIDFHWGSAPPVPAVPPGDFIIKFTGRVFVSVQDAYTFYIRTSGGVRFWISEQPVDIDNDIPIIDEWTNTLPKEFNSSPIVPGESGKCYYFSLEYINSTLDAFLRLSWETPSSAKAVIPNKRLFSNAAIDFAPIIESYIRLHKTALLVKSFKISRRELFHLAENASDFDALELNSLPLDKVDFTPNLFQQWERLYDLFLLREGAPRGDRDLIDLFMAAKASPAALDEIKDLLVAIFTWEPTDVDELIAEFDLHAVDFANEIWPTRLHACTVLRKQLGVTPLTLFSWAMNDPDHIQAAEMREALKIRLDDVQWLKTIKPFSDSMREKKRAALISYLLPRPKTVSGADWSDVNDLFSHFLIDVEMSPCQLTSRIKQAISSTQLFIQRSLMNLEEEVYLGEQRATQWRQWMKNYRLWEANRKVFLYPENWVEPGLRGNKSPIFEEMENELLQNEITNDTAELALLHYLEKLNEVARLQVSGMYYQLEDWVNGSPQVNVLHVFARTYSTPHIYYYRRWVDSAYWTPWEKVEVDIEGDHLIPVVYNRRVYLFWPIFAKKAALEARIPAQDADAAEKVPKTVYEIQFAWSEYRDDKWSAKKVSSEFVTTVGQSQDLRDFVFKAGFDQQQKLAIGCYARGAV